MAEQLDLLSAGAAARDEGVDRVWRNTDEHWRVDALAAIEYLARSGRQFCSEDLRAIVGDPPEHYNAMGAAFRVASRRGLIRKVGWTTATRPSLHATDLRLWEGV